MHHGRLNPYPPNWAIPGTCHGSLTTSTEATNTDIYTQSFLLESESNSYLGYNFYLCSGVYRVLGFKAFMFSNACVMGEASRIVINVLLIAHDTIPLIKVSNFYHQFLSFLFVVAFEFCHYNYLLVYLPWPRLLELSFYVVVIRSIWLLRSWAYLRCIS